MSRLGRIDRDQNQDYNRFPQGPQRPGRPQGHTPPPAPPPPPDYSTAFSAMSDNGSMVAMAQIMGMEFALQQASLDREMQFAAKLELGLEKLDTNLQVSEMNFVQAMRAEENDHIEAVAEIRQKHAALESSGSRYVEFAPPELFTDSF